LTGCPSQAVTVATSAARHQSVGDCVGRQACGYLAYQSGVNAVGSAVLVSARFVCGDGTFSGAIFPDFAAAVAAGDAVAGVGALAGAG
jgi:hypothetical protein